jgi:hypothetical protein
MSDLCVLYVSGKTNRERHVLALELAIDPDLGKNQAFAALTEWRMA